MAITFTPLQPVIAAECSGVDIGEPLGPAEAAAIDEGMDRYAVLVFPRGIPLTTEQQIAFARNFGELERPYTQIQSPEGKRLGSPHPRRYLEFGAAATVFCRATTASASSVWGTSCGIATAATRPFPPVIRCSARTSFRPRAATRNFADMRAAYDALDGKTKVLIEDLVCEHSRIFSKGALGFSFTEEDVRAFAPVRQRLVRTHRRTGRKSLYLSSHAGRIVGWPVPEAMLLPRELMEHATQREFVYSHRWRVGDLVMWDNRTTMHRARRYEDERDPRDLRRTTLTDGVPTVAQQPSAAA